MDRIWTVVRVGGSPSGSLIRDPREEDQELRDHPKDALASRGHGPTIEPYSTSGTISRPALRLGRKWSEKRQSLILKTKILKTKESGGKGVKLSASGSPFFGFSGTARILRMGFQLKTL
ncbi:hypothetical protein IFM89_036972 [Coptis chinensis]|uniref:Uncharacterized protein n=1 Tax=Coptis chinensis TaxID=261450 RepID=A0A835HBF7_9MAGN|nr:hypothetical protein IFM89_036972 [Coptis chinensis]